jgi:glyoxylase-like metal-dependent hydrolase (beta-lactamase superfamily II)
MYAPSLPKISSQPLWEELTPMPVKFVVNTHFHWDRYQGNEAYPSSWPVGVEIISSEATRTSIEQRGIPRVKHEIVTMPAQIEQLKADLQKASTPEHRDSIQKNISEAEGYLTELKSTQITLPTMTFDRNLIVHRKSRTVELLWLGRAHTDGDVFVFPTKEKVLVTGDALHGWTPYMGDSYPYDWIKTLDVAKKPDFDYSSPVTATSCPAKRRSSFGSNTFAICWSRPPLLTPMAPPWNKLRSASPTI